MRVNSGNDAQARMMGGDTSLGFAGTSSAVSVPTATTLTDNAAPAWTVNQWVGHMVSTGAVYGVVLSNTALALTVDMWHTPATPETAAATPAGGLAYVISPGSAPAFWLGLSAATRTIAAADTFLTNDGATVSEPWVGGGGLNRARAAYTHTAGAAAYTLSKTFTSNASDNAGAAITVHRIGVFLHQVSAAPTTTTSGVMVLETNLNNDAILVPTAGDAVTITESVSI